MSFISHWPSWDDCMADTFSKAANCELTVNQPHWVSQQWNIRNCAVCFVSPNRVQVWKRQKKWKFCRKASKAQSKNDGVSYRPRSLILESACPLHSKSDWLEIGHTTPSQCAQQKSSWIMKAHSNDYHFELFKKYVFFKFNVCSVALFGLMPQWLCTKIFKSCTKLVSFSIKFIKGRVQQENGLESMIKSMICSVIINLSTHIPSGNVWRQTFSLTNWGHHKPNECIIYNQFHRYSIFEIWFAWSKVISQSVYKYW